MQYYSVWIENDSKQSFPCRNKHIQKRYNIISEIPLPFDSWNNWQNMVLNSVSERTKVKQWLQLYSNALKFKHLQQTQQLMKVSRFSCPHQFNVLLFLTLLNWQQTQP